jgi:quinohemoprotein ethanol dehydrogenase
VRAAAALALLLLVSPAAAAAQAAVTDARLGAAGAHPADWLAHGRTWSEQRFSPLAQVNEATVAALAPAWVYATGETRGHEATPLVADGVMWTTLPWSIVVALDAASGRELWRFDPEVPKAWGRHACCDVVNRGVALYRGRVYVGTLDGRLVALDAKTGAPVWQTLTIDPSRPYTITGAPRVAQGLVFIGNGGAEFGVRGYVSAYDAETGALVWRFHTVPGPPDRPQEHPALERAAKTWPADATWESGLGGTVWDSLAYDPALGFLYVGVGNSSPYDRRVRSPGGGDNLYLASILALRAQTGELVWHYQTTPGENWDYTATQHMILAELKIRGRTRRVLMQAPKNGFFYVLDRATGELLSAEPYASVSWASHVDRATGRPVETGRAEWHEAPAMVIPGVTGAHNWHPMAFHPQTGLVYVPTQELAYPFHPNPKYRHRPGFMNTAEDLPGLARSIDGFERALRFCSPSRLTAWDPVAQRQVWQVSHDSEVNGGALATAGNLVFQGSGDGALVAYRATDGVALWKSEIGIGVMAPPISYRAGGEQYVAVTVGVGGSAGLNLTQFDYQNAGYVVAFKLGGTAALPRVAKRPPGVVQVPRGDASPEQVARGQTLYGEHCFRCHGIGTKSGGLLPDLRFSSPEVHARWNDIVLGGVRADRGMASFADVLGPAEAADVQAYVLAQAHREPSWLERAAAWLVEQGACVPAAWVVD